MKRLGNEAGIVHRLLVAIGGFQAGSVGFGKFDLPTVADTLSKYAGLKKSIKELEDQEKKYGSFPPITARRLKSLRKTRTKPRMHIKGSENRSPSKEESPFPTLKASTKRNREENRR